LRLERGLSQRELASPGVSYAYISRIEADARRPSVKALRQLARKLRVSVEYLETGSELRDIDERELRLADAELQLRLGETETAEQTLRHLLAEAEAAGDSTGALRAQVALGLAAAKAGRSAIAIEHLEPAARSGSVSPVRRPDLYATLGQCYAAVGQLQRAVDLFQQCLEHVTAAAPTDVAAQVRFATYLSYALSDMDELERAEAVVADALERAGDEGADGYTRVRLYWSLARLNQLHDEPAAALEYARKAIALLEVTDDTLHLARAHLLCGSIMMMQGKLEAARAHYESAERLFGPRLEPLDRANLRTDQARCAAARRRPAEAERLAREAVEALAGDYPAERGVALGALADALAQQGKPDADDAFEKAAALLDAHGRHIERIETYRSWARHLRNSGREGQALDVLDRAAQLSATQTKSRG
jgi:tetratricopeptide (TPR) repeat protein